MKVTELRKQNFLANKDVDIAILDTLNFAASRPLQNNNPIAVIPFKLTIRLN